jgi:hypothetical protein
LCSAAKVLTSRRNGFRSSRAARATDSATGVLGEEGDHLTAHLQIGDVGIEQHPFDTVDLPTHVTVEHIVDVQGAPGDNFRNALCRARAGRADGGRGVGVKDALRGGHRYTDTEVDRQRLEGPLCRMWAPTTWGRALPAGQLRCRSYWINPDSVIIPTCRWPRARCLCGRREKQRLRTQVEPPHSSVAGMSRL